MTWLTEVVLLGNSDAQQTELSLTEDTRTLLELALGSTRGLAGVLWWKMEEYALSKGNLIGFSLYVYISTPASGDLCTKNQDFD